MNSPGDALIEVERLVPGGRGMARLADGRPAFVSGAFPGDRVKIRESVDRRSFVEVSAFSLERASSDRVSPACAFAEACGGCDWMAISGSAQLSAKESIIRQALERVGKLALADIPFSMVAAPSSIRYRSRLRLQVKDGRLGFFTRKSHELVEVDDCLVSSERLWQAVQEVREVVRAFPRAFRDVVHAEVRVLPNSPPSEGALKPDATTTSVAFALSRGRAGPGAARPTDRNLGSELESALRSLRTMMVVRVDRADAIVQSHEGAGGVSILAPVGGFTQVNDEVNRLLVERVVSEAQARGVVTFLDLYCGSGNFSFPLLRRGMKGIGVEASDEAVRAAQASSQHLGLPGEFYAEACEEFLASERARSKRFDLVLVDPPRAGAKPCIRGILDVFAPHVFMVSCDPATLARDLAALTAGGYRLVRILGYDMFPQTHHVETLAILERNEFPRLSSSASYVDPDGRE